MVTIERLSETHLNAVSDIELEDEQTKFAGTAKEFLADGSETTHLHIIKHDNQVVGFFKLDIAYRERYLFCSKDGLGLRAFALDKKYQGKGLGTTSIKALFTYIRKSYSSYNKIYLTVNCKNPAAQACYLKGGFQCDDNLYLEGPAGPQWIMYGVI
ncbi:GNAT family N-acetyltransferase [Vibrio parahaemolyticus]